MNMRCEHVEIKETNLIFFKSKSKHRYLENPLIILKHRSVF